MSTAPLITIYVRHGADCRYRDDETWKRCQCRKWLRYTLNGTQYRVKSGTRSWSDAEEKKRQLEDQLSGRTPLEAPEEQPRGIQDAIDLFIEDKKAQGVTDDVIAKYNRELGRLRSFMEFRGIYVMTGIGREQLIKYQATWDDLYPSSQTRLQVRARLGGFLDFCYDLRLMDRVPRLANVKAEEAPTLPLTPAEYQKLLSRLPDAYPDLTGLGPGKAAGPEKPVRVRAFIQCMRWTGLAIRDTTELQRTSLRKDRDGVYSVLTARQKTGTDVYVPIPPEVAKELLACPGGNKEYFFWPGSGAIKTAVTHWQEDIKVAFNNARIYGGHMVSHRLRDTFAVDLLEKGVPMEEVSKLLGHESIRTTERHYAKWNKGRQDRLKQLVTGTWK